MLVHDFLDYYARNAPESPCLSLEGETRSYADIRDQSNQLANGLLELGVGTGERVAVVGENSFEHCLVMMAASRIGAVAVPLNYRLAPAEIGFIVSDAATKVLVVLPGMEPMLEDLRDQLPADTRVVAQGQGTDLDLVSWLAGQSSAAPELDIDPAAPYMQLYTSGTTGNPKGAVSNHNNLIALTTMNMIATPYRSNQGSAGIVCAPLFHIGGAGSLFAGIYHGQHTLLHKVFDPARIIDDIEAHPVGNVFMVPAMIMMVLQIPGIRERDFSQLEQIFYGASPISESVLREAMEVFQCDFVQMYGMTETTGTLVNLSPEDHRKALDGRPDLLRSCGRPSVGAKAKVVDSDGRELPAGEIGEIWLKAVTNMLQYHNLPEATASTLTDGWIHTGDAGYMDEEGYLYLKDRMKDMVVSGGENIYPVEVENAIAKHDAVADVAVIGVPDDKFGEALLAFVVTRPDTVLETDEMIEFCRDKIAGYKIPRQLQIIDELPRNPSGKILKKILRAPFWEGVDRGIG